MADIEINKPFKISLEMVEFDDRLPSIKFSVKIEIRFLTSSILYESQNMWFKCNDWDSFNQKQITEEATLSDMSKGFILSITHPNEGIKLSCKIEKILPDSTSNIELSFIIDSDTLYNLKQAFIGYPKWWQ